jgi:hypothetical protein
MRRGANEALTLVELAFFPHVLLRRATGDHQNHKPYIDKASSYAKVISYALAHKVKPADLVKFIRDNGGIQAIAKAETERCPRHSQRTGVRLGKSPSAAAAASAPIVVKPPRPGHRLIPLNLWCAGEMAAKIIEATFDAYYTDSGHFIIHGHLYDTKNAIVTDFVMAPKLRPIANPPIRQPEQQPTGKPGPTSWRGSVPVVKGMRPSAPQPKRMPSQPPTPLGKTPLGKTPFGKGSGSV